MNKKPTKLIFVLLFTLILVACTDHSNSTNPTPSPETKTTWSSIFHINPPYRPSKTLDSLERQEIRAWQINHSEGEILSFLDSLGKLPPSKLDDSVNWQSLPPKWPRLGIHLSNAQFQTLKSGSKHKKISKDFAKALHLDMPRFDDHVDSVTIAYTPFQGNFEYYAIESYPDFEWEAKLAFFYRDELLEVHEVHPRWGLPLNSYIDADSNRIVHYRECLSEGTGAGDWRDYYYVWEPKGLRPALVTIGLGHNQNSIRMYTLSGRQIAFDSLVIQYQYDQSLNDYSKGYAHLQIINDSCRIHYVYDDAAKRFQPDWAHSKITKWQMLTYLTGENDPLFIHSHHRLLKRLLQGNDAAKRQATQFYLSQAIDQNYPTGKNAKR
jgi:hypothetical protein